MFGLVDLSPTGLKLSYTHKLVGQQYAKASVSGGVVQRFILPHYTVGTAVASYTWKQFTLSVSVNNVFNDRSTTGIGLGTFNATTGNFAPVGTYYTFQGPRTFEASIRAKF